jgi:hypothetical protein
MPSKKFDLEKSKAKKTLGKLAQSGIPPRFGALAAAPDRREQRRLDQAAGLVPFATKLPGDLVAALNAAAQAEGVAPAEWLTRLLRERLTGGSTGGEAALPASAPGYHGLTDIQEG